MRIMVTGGGTGGHTSPAVAIIEELQRRDPRLSVQWVGRRGAIEERVSQANAIPFRSLPVEGWPRERSLRKAWVGAKMACAIARGALLVRKFHPQIVLGVGGYVSLPLTWTAQRMGVPTVLHEQNKRLGLANRLLAPRATRLFLSYPNTLGEYPEEKALVTGNPVRQAFAHPPSREDACATLGLDPTLPVVLVSGGSQGARTLNNAMAHIVRNLDPDELQVLWMTGRTAEDEAGQAAGESAVPVHVFPFIEDMATACAAADLVIGRAGASTTAELAQLGKPSILVPFPHAADNHQEQNARAFEEAGGAHVLLDDECTGPALLDLVRQLVADPAQLDAIGAAAATLAQPAAAETIAEEILAIAVERAH